MLIICHSPLFVIVVNGHNCVAVRNVRRRTATDGNATQRNMPHKSSSMLRPSPYTYVCVNAAVEIIVCRSVNGALV